VRRSTGQWYGEIARVAVACGVIAAVISAGGVRAAENVASNIDLMQQLTAAVIGELHGKFNGSVNGRAVQLKPAGSTEDYLFVTNVFREELTRLGVKTIDTSAPLSVSTPAPATGANGQPTTTNPAIIYPDQTSQSATDTTADNVGTTMSNPVTSNERPLVLQYQNVVFDLKYVDSHRAFLVGGKRVDRRAAVRIITTITDPADGGRVVWVGEAARDHEDEVDYGDATRMEQGTYSFIKPVVPSAGWGRYAEPVFVTGIIVGLVYLFFSNQSDN
jgi:hypothetical protein